MRRSSWGTGCTWSGVRGWGGKGKKETPYVQCFRGSPKFRGGRNKCDGMEDGKGENIRAIWRRTSECTPENQPASARSCSGSGGLEGGDVPNDKMPYRRGRKRVNTITAGVATREGERGENLATTRG